MKYKRLVLLCLIMISLLPIISACGKEPEKTVETEFLMDTLMELTAYGPNGEKAIDAAMGRIKKIDDLMSVSSETGDVYKVNKSAGQNPVKVSDETMYVVQTAQHYSQLSDGAFDITVGPLVNLWGIGKKEEVPSQTAIDGAKALIDYRKLQIDVSSGTIGLPERNMSIDLGAIAKGYAGDEAARIFKEYGVKSGIISLGGNVVVVGARPDGNPWRVGIQNPFKPTGNYVAVVEETDKTVVTSGTYERYFIKDGKRYHHILDPSTGYPADNGLASVSIISDKSIDADALSTTVFLLGPEKGMELVEELSDVECIMITNDKKITVSSGLKDNINITDEEFIYEEGR
ncbi:FAD:protein FMN transferase [Mahella sp.]|uniref:FAD:protein FMN transferase n=1 Tax=Mahella sp. TaxID=2798721 RepID=UPI0025C262AF|nr:FAD:protein FMN transferase [Mahella sp.]MBZ4665282.1 ApbE family lipoprotein [Mahella sp.]MDK2902473.1 FAD:protein transferase [Clostridiales bacterium]